ncbi:hypothetical protein DY467_05590 [Rhodopseudomonas sp. BR0G17]|nr:hypothetical protein [Rhodopseudomonas sp. BR0G17]
MSFGRVGASRSDTEINREAAASSDYDRASGPAHKRAKQLTAELAAGTIMLGCDNWVRQAAVG